MQKELKAMDAQLSSNGFIRIQDSTAKSENSLFRALSMAVYHNHQQTSELKQQLKLTLVNNLADKKNNCYPLLSDTNLLKKYQCNQQLILDYWQKQDLECFLNDNLNLASAAFGRTICILCLDKEGYLCQSYITACKHQSKHIIYLAKVNKKFYCVFQLTTHALINYIKGGIVEQLINSVVLGVQGKKYSREEKVIIHHYDDIHHRRQHKKSLSDCDQVPIQLQLEERKKQFQESSDRGCKQNNVRLYDSVEIVNKTEDDYFDFNVQGRASYKSADQNNRAYTQPYNYFPYPYPYYNQHDPTYINQEHYVAEQPYGYAQALGPINNERYTGRLKFFDQNGNYGYIFCDLVLSLSIILILTYSFIMMIYQRQVSPNKNLFRQKTIMTSDSSLPTMSMKESSIKKVKKPQISK